VFTPLVLSPYGGWHGGCGNEQWTSRMTHTGDDAPFHSYGERFEHPARPSKKVCYFRRMPGYHGMYFLQ
jgi:hypothetical protein